MFKKIVSRISFSPALVAQLGFYAKRLRKERATRRLGLIFVALALVVQSMAVFQAPEPANAAHTSNMVEGGLGWSNPDLGRYLSLYDSNAGYTKDATNYFGITRAELAAAKYGSFPIAGKVSWGWDYPMPTSRAVAIKNSQGTTVRTLYGRWMKDNASNPPTVTGFIGHSSKIGWFAISTACGNITTVDFPPPPTPPPAPAKITTTKSAVNISQAGADATKVTAKANDTITYTVSAKNTGGTAKQIELVDMIGEVLSYAAVTSTGGGVLNQDKGTLTWPSTTLGAGQSIEKKYTVKMKSSLISPTDSCKMTNTFTDKKVTIAVGCSTPPAEITASKQATNVTQGGIDATKTLAKASDQITFTLSASNTGGTPKEVALDDYIGDVLEYSTLTNNGGGTYNDTTKTLSWPQVTLKPGAKETRIFTVTMLPTIPASAKNVSETSSYNCTLENMFLGASVTIDVDCPTPKIIESTVTELPQTGAGANIVFGGLLLAIVSYFYLRSRQLSTEVRLVRRNVHDGTF